ncbi:hypothetical protein ABW286_14205 [Erwinia papayae]|uniref:Phage protein n=1 Tax=Erwinia papayae TaxID=206499 RepID=A0ABV3N3C6_9GAMM
MEIHKTKLRLEDAGFMAKSLSGMLHAFSCHANSIEDEDMESILFIASKFADEISRGINTSVDELIKGVE